MSIKISQDKIIDQFKAIHGSKYDYSKSLYINAQTNIIIICKEHGEFLQCPHSHKKGRGCGTCSGNKFNLNWFIFNGNKLHNQKYLYHKSNYKDTDTLIDIVCPIHGEFKQTPHNHINLKYGCKECGYLVSKSKNTKNLTKFIKQANFIHDSYYDYSKSIYSGCKNKLIITCPKHGEFKQEASGHLSGNGCSNCFKSTSKQEKAWLDYLKIEECNRNTSLKINGSWFYPDGIDVKNKIIYEFYGDFWHGNPSLFKPMEINKVSNKTFGILYKKTMDKEIKLINAGYKLISIWETEWNEICQMK